LRGAGSEPEYDEILSDNERECDKVSNADLSIKVVEAINGLEENELVCIAGCC
jgi:hypothetical protein